MVVTAVYKDGSSSEVTDYTTNPSTDQKLKTTDTKVTVTYTEGSIVATKDFAINVSYTGFVYTPISATECKVKYSGTCTETDLVIPSSTIIEGVTYKVVEIDTSGFENQKTIASVTLPSSITKINAKAFKGCDSLTSVTFPNTMHPIKRTYNSMTSYFQPNDASNNATTLKNYNSYTFTIEPLNEMFIYGDFGSGSQTLSMTKESEDLFVYRFTSNGSAVTFKFCYTSKPDYLMSYNSYIKSGEGRISIPSAPNNELKIDNLANNYNYAIYINLKTQEIYSDGAIVIKSQPTKVFTQGDTFDVGTGSILDETGTEVGLTNQMCSVDGESAATPLVLDMGYHNVEVKYNSFTLTYKIVAMRSAVTSSFELNWDEKNGGYVKTTNLLQLNEGEVFRLTTILDETTPTSGKLQTLGQNDNFEQAGTLMPPPINNSLPILCYWVSNDGTDYIVDEPKTGTDQYITQIEYPNAISSKKSGRIVCEYVTHATTVDIGGDNKGVGFIDCDWY